jgi:hypothetical protein
MASNVILNDGVIDPVAIGRATAVADCVPRIRAEYLELPNLSLTAAQAQRLWSLDSETCRAVLDTMVRQAFLRRTPHAHYVRQDWCGSDDDFWY